MSASTVAITANPVVQRDTSLALDPDSKPRGRRRKAVVAENKSTVDLVVDGEDPGVSNDNIVTDGKDLHTISPEVELDRPQEFSHPKKSLIVASTLSARRKRSALKPEKPRWQTVLSIVTKNFLLLTVIFGLGWIIWKYADQNVERTSMPFSVVHLEGRVSDVEASLKATEKMMQVQLEKLDRKLDSEIDGARRELTEQIAEESAFFEEELDKLEAKTENLGKSLSDVKDPSFFTQDFKKLLNDLERSQTPEEKGKIWGLDDIRTYAREAIVREIEKHAADGLGMVDYALASGGARVVQHSEPYGLGKGSWFPIGKSQNKVHANAHKMLEPSFGEPGQCFPLHGSTGFVEVKLRTAIILDSITLEHVSKSVAYDRSSAPKDCQISAWFEDTSIPIQRMIRLLEFTYDLEKSNAQTFNVETADTGVVDMVRLDFSSNHGSSSHTCIYRLRVHGYNPKSFVEMAVQA